MAFCGMGLVVLFHMNIKLWPLKRIYTYVIQATYNKRFDHHVTVSLLFHIQGDCVFYNQIKASAYIISFKL